MIRPASSRLKPPLPRACRGKPARTFAGGAHANRVRGQIHASEGGARADDVATSICAVLLAEACNTRVEPLIRLDRPPLRRSRLSWVRQNYIRAETLTRANAALVAAQNRVPLARSWGGGNVASADGLRSVVPIRTIHSGPISGSATTAMRVAVIK